MARLIGSAPRDGESGVRGRRVVFGRVKPREVDQAIRELRQVNPKDWE